MRQLDGLRCIAVFMVIVSHWAPRYQRFYCSGELGVGLFFAISGYLITGILLRLRDKNSPMRALKVFYARRFLRIFPAYYAVLASIWLLDVAYVRESLAWHAFYLSNLYIAKLGTWPGSLSHFWPLSVEEQYYLFWPLLMLFLPWALLLPAVLACPWAGTYTSYLQHWGIQGLGLIVLPFSWLRFLGLGSLLALLDRWQVPGLLLVTRLVTLSSGAIWLHAHLTGNMGLAYYSCPYFLAGITYWGAQGFGQPLGPLLASKPMVYLGEISYGLYLFHNFIPEQLDRLSWRWFGQGIIGNWEEPTILIMNLGVLVSLASCSWFFYERPWNRLKSRFPYQEKTK